MKQVFLSGKGIVEVVDVPAPGKLPGSVLVRNAYSVISSGTEGSAVTRHGGWLGLYEKAMASKDRFDQVSRLARTEGILRTWELVAERLDDATPLGYSSAGEVVETYGENVPYKPGDRIACMGVGFASHAEYVVVPKNLTTPIPELVATDEAAFGALACIALQGIRRLELTPGERVGVIGLGLIGQVCLRLLNAMGYRAFGMDKQPRRAAKACEVEGVIACPTNEEDTAQDIGRQFGVSELDGVVICASSSSDAPVNLAFDLCRQRGRVSVIGDVGLGLRREKMYRKELELRLSCSYGPGRYDDAYEIRGQDYPIGQVRWTENRSLEYFLELLATKRLSLRPLISAEFPVDDAPAAYACLKAGNPDIHGILFRYPHEETTAPAARILVSPSPKTVAHEGVIRLGLIGAGGYAKSVHIPNLQRLPNLFKIRGVATRSGGTAALVARKAGADIAASDARVLFDDPEIDAVLIATRHASHAQLVLDALDAGKHVFVEKPMTLTVEDGQAIALKANETGRIVRVGFNRRFAPSLQAMRSAMGAKGPRFFSCRVNISLPTGHWSNTEEEGGRLLSEGVHFFDLCNWFVGQEPVSVSAAVAGELRQTNPNVAVTVTYPESSVAQVIYTSFGHSGMGKEYYEAFGNSHSARCDDFQTLDIFGMRKSLPRRDRGDKGQKAALEEFAAAIRGEPFGEVGADARAGLLATWMALTVYESARTGSPVRWTL